MAEDPKQFLKQVKRGIGPSARHPLDEEVEVVNFDDFRGAKCRLECGGSFLTFVVGPDAESFVLSQGQVQRLINTLERWVHTGSFGHPEEG